jgi:enoyl-CoA hydratase
MGQYLDLETDERGVSTITLHHGKVNALSTALLAELGRAAATVDANGSRCVIITGGSRLFAAGADITEFAEGSDTDAFRIAPAERVAEVGSAFLDALGAVEAIAVPTIASVSGVALGGGCELALACDIRVASDAARFGQPEILLGIIPGGGGTQRLARLVGPAVAKEMILSGRTVGADEALRIGLVNTVVPADELDAAVDTMAAGFAAGPPAAIRIAKSVIDRGLDTDLARGLALEADAFVEVFATPDASVGVASFLTDGPGKADFSGLS